MDKITSASEVHRLFRTASKQKFWGNIIFSFQNGKLNVIKKEATVKVPSINFDTSEIDDGANKDV